MKIRILDRILVALAGLLMLAGCAACAAGTAYVFRNAYNHLSETRRAKP